MDVFNAIKTRRSVRRFQKRTVPAKYITAILEAGRWAPSGLNNQPWRFLVIEDAVERRRLAQCTTSAGIITGATALIAIFLDTKSSYHREKDSMAIGACIENMLLAAHGQGVGGCWLGEILNKKHVVSALLKVDKALDLMAVIALGYPSRVPSPGRRVPLKKLCIRTPCPL